jgi:hypothetical protein
MHGSREVAANLVKTVGVDDGWDARKEARFFSVETCQR